MQGTSDRAGIRTRDLSLQSVLRDTEYSQLPLMATAAGSQQLCKAEPSSLKRHTDK